MAYSSKTSSSGIYAWDLLFNFNFTEPPIDVESLCEKLNIDIIYEDLDQIYAFFIQKNAKKKIILNKNKISYDTKTRFTIAHELGHYILPNHRLIYNCSIDDIMNFNSNKKEEREANEFASELLMPKNIFLKDVKEHELNFDNIMKLSNIYQTSLTATAIKFIKTTFDKGAIFLSDYDGNILWGFATEDIYNINTNKIHEESITYDYLNTFEGKYLKEPQRVPSYCWFDEENYENKYICFEETKIFNKLKQAFTLVTLQEK